MTIQLNGESRSFEVTELTLAGLLEQLGLDGKPVVVELDREVVFPADYGSAAVQNGASIEIVTIAAGG